MIKDAFRKADDMAQEVLEGFKDNASCSTGSSVSREGRKPRNNGFADSGGWSCSRNMNCGFEGERGDWQASVTAVSCSAAAVNCKQKDLFKLLSLALFDVLTRGERQSDSALLYAAPSQVWY